MEHELTELRLFIENESALYGKVQAITAALDRKIKQGKYDSALAPKAWLYLVDDGAVAYVIAPRPVYKATTAEKNEARRVFPTALRKKLAEEMRDAYESEAGERGVQIHPERHLCGSCAKHETKAMKRVGTSKRRGAPMYPASEWKAGIETHALKNALAAVERAWRKQYRDPAGTDNSDLIHRTGEKALNLGATTAQMHAAMDRAQR